jgi:hypothetical protein
MPIDLVQGLIARWSDLSPSHVALLRQAGIEAIVLERPDPAFSEACRAAGIAVTLRTDFEWTDAKGLSSVPGTKPLILTEGTWPGVARDPAIKGRGDETASASREPWIEINGHWIPYLRALRPDTPAVLGYTADVGNRLVPYDSLELALIEARVFGGNYLLSIEPTYRAALLSGNEKAITAWRQLGRTARWLREQSSLLGQPMFPILTQVVEPGKETAEIAKLLYRRNASPALVAVDGIPPPDLDRRLVLVAAGLKSPSAETRRRILAHAERGATVVVNGAGWTTDRDRPVRTQPDRDFFAVGQGHLVVYRGAISDPSEFALDAIDLVTHKRRAVRLWNALAVVAVATGNGIMCCINYGSPANSPVQARIQGVFSKATLLRPEAGSVELPVARRGATSEVFLPELRRLGVVVFR